MEEKRPYYSAMLENQNIGAKQAPSSLNSRFNLAVNSDLSYAPVEKWASSTMQYLQAMAGNANH
jgi:hypothetical protein